MMHIAIHNLRPQAVWTIHGEHEYQNLVWLDQNQTKPTEEEISAEVARLEAEAARTEYRHLRAAEYPPIGDQLDALWKGGAAAEEMLATVMAVKAKYPKPE